MRAPTTSMVESQLRALMLGLFVIGLAGVAAELLALQHYEDPWQFVPFAVIVAALVTAVWQVVAGSAASVRTMRGVALVMLVTGALGIVLHYRGNMGFQLDVNPDLHGWRLFLKILHAQAPPALAPGVMAQLGLLGLVYCFRHPLLMSRTVKGD